MFLCKKLIVLIHDLHPWGGQDKSNLEILYPIQQQIPLEVHSYTFTDSREWKNKQQIKYSFPSAPLIFKSLHFSLFSLLKLNGFIFKKNRRKQGSLLQTTGIASWVADVIQVQFIHKTWRKIQDEYDLNEHPTLIKGIYHFFLQFYNILFENILFNNSKKFIAISHKIKKELMEEFKISEKNITTIYHGIDTKYFYPPRQSQESKQQRERIRAELQIKPEEILILHSGALNARKGVPLALKTLGVLKNLGFSNFKYLAVGAGNQKKMAEIASQENITENVIFISHSKNIRDYYWASDIFFFPTVYEPFGLVILEAMACGLACIVSPLAGATELIIHGENGIILENIFSPQSMAQQLAPLLKDSDLRDKLSAQGVLTAQERLWETVAQEYLNFYKDNF